MTLQECVKYLEEEGYLITLNKLPYFTKKFYKEFVDKDMGIVVLDKTLGKVEVQEAVVKPKKTVTLFGGVATDVTKVNWAAVYHQFLLALNIPRWHYTPNGTRYQLNMATKPGREAFKKALLEGISYDELLEGASSYYRTVTEYPKKIENYFVDELWRNTMEDGSDGDSIARPKSVG